VSSLSVTGASDRVLVRLTVSERSTINVRFARGGDVFTTRSQVEAGRWTLQRPLARGAYTYELWAVDAMGNRSATYPGEVRVGG
jgi:hypothetical protein